MKTINFTKFPLLDRSGNIQEADIAKLLFNTAYNQSRNRDDVVKNLSFKEDQDIELTDENIEYFSYHLGFIQPATVLYSFEKYIEK